MLRASRLLCLVLSLVAVTARPASSTLRHVHPDGSGDYPTIQSAITASVDGDEVLLAPGTYRGPGNRSLDCTGLEITIHSEGNDPASCILDCEGVGYGIRLISASGPGFVLEGLTIANGRTDTGGGVNLRYQVGPVIRNCRFISCSSTSDGGGVSSLQSSPLITDCVFLRCNAAVFGGALNVQTGSDARLERCLIQDCAALYGAGVEAWDNADLTAVQCTFTGNRADAAGGAVECFAGSTLVVDHCTMFGNAGHGSGLSCPAPTPSSLIVTHSIVAFGSYPAVYCNQGNPYHLTCCDIFGNGALDWTPCIADQLGVDGNLHADPLFCQLQDPEFPYGLQAESPCAPESNPDCGLIGAWPVECDVTGIPDRPATTAARAELRFGCDPNPLSGWTRISYVLPAASRRAAVRLDVCDASGRVLRHLTGAGADSPADSGAGRGNLVWDGRDEAGRKVPSGVYFCRLEGGGQRAVRTLVVSR